MGNDTFAERLKELRKLNGDTQATLSQKLFVSQGAVSCYEQGTARPSYETLITICKIYEASADYLLGLTDIDPSDNARRCSQNF